ncbi:putative RING-H2 finger protein ATL21A isoform X2 [Medicago truncatula]|uniref:RING-type E3 ubiquitin transferase n=2 Tax=Medicago truncatula TaxID=3880 RepID=G7L440_MEDTR|nr:putative RING-H2 finger protein ATL21A isoform X2 [Medicago truncatula]AES82790.1 RING-H2 finger protein ATL21A, putative [Medicago truncatula]
MDILKFFFHLFILFPVIYTSEDYCQNSWCSENNILIRFPFQLEVDGDPRPYCGYPGFKLSCTNDGKTVLTLPYSGVFYVRKINYLEHHIQVYDPHRCLPNRLLSLNLSGSPFVTELLTNYTVLSCSTPNMLGSQFTLDCLSNSTHFVSAIPSLSFTNSLPQSCYIIRNFSVPVASSYPEFFLNNFSEDLELTWSSPDCRYCELQDRMCGFESRNNNQVRCFSNQQTGHSQHSLMISRIIILSIGGAMMCGIGIGCVTWFKRRRRTISAEPSIDITITRMRMGLDESTIESFGKVVLGESRRLPGVGHNDGTGCCSICLSEYNSKDIIRCIPECKHCFHAHCIDEWLRMNATCPVCRNSPFPSHSLLQISS